MFGYIKYDYYEGIKMKMNNTETDQEKWDRFWNERKDLGRFHLNALTEEEIYSFLPEGIEVEREDYVPKDSVYPKCAFKLYTSDIFVFKFHSDCWFAFGSVTDVDLCRKLYELVYKMNSYGTKKFNKDREKVENKLREIL